MVPKRSQKRKSRAKRKRRNLKKKERAKRKSICQGCTFGFEIQRELYVLNTLIKTFSVALDVGRWPLVHFLSDPSFAARYN